MADPIKYTPAYDFSNFQAVRPNAPLPGDRVDIELQNIEDVIDVTIEALKDVRRADGKLQNGSVTADSFEAGLRDAITTDTYAASEAAAASAAAASTSQGAAAASASAALASQGAAAASASAALAVEANLPDWRGAWVTATAYDTGDLVRVLGSSYICLIAHTAAADFSTDLSASRWDLFAQEGAAGPGTGDMLAANNLTDVADPATAVANLGLTTATGLFPSGGIIMWSGSVATVPTGWALCNGASGTPNLTGRFIVHADADTGGTYAPGATGGLDTVTLTGEQMPAHIHGVNINTNSAGAHTHSIRSDHSTSSPVTPRNNRFGLLNDNVVDAPGETNSAGAHAHNVSGNTASAGSGGSHENRPPYYALAYIMKL